MGFLGFLGLLFVALKLIGIITWSWWLVTLPIYGGVLFWLIISFVGVIALAMLNRR